MTKIAQIDDHGSALAWSPVKDHADVVALGTKVRHMGTKQSDHGQKLKLKVPFGKQQVVAEWSRWNDGKIPAHLCNGRHERALYRTIVVVVCSMLDFCFWWLLLSDQNMKPKATTDRTDQHLGTHSYLHPIGASNRPH